MNKLSRLAFIVTLLMFTLSKGWAGDLTIPNSFTAGTPAVAADVNANFNAVEAEVDDNNARLSALEALVATLQTDLTNANNTIATLQTDLINANNIIATLQTAMIGKADVGHNHDTNYAALSHDHTGVYAPVSHSHAQADITGLTSALATHSSQISAINNSEVMALDPYVAVASDIRGPLVRISGVNLQVVNGAGTTDSNTPNGLGNIIIGYDEENNLDSRCSLGTYTNQIDCETNGYTWATSHKSGQHNLVLGTQNNYSRFGGIVVGHRNIINGDYAYVTGGTGNSASGTYSSVTGGQRNNASGWAASISGGGQNTASGATSMVSGGAQNTASGATSMVSGGAFNTASGVVSTISGGDSNNASGERASISGGWNNTASNNWSSVSGGRSNTASGWYSSILGGNTVTVSTMDGTSP